MAEKKSDEKDDRSALEKAQLRWLDNRDDPKALAAVLAEEAKLATGDTPTG